MATKKPGSAKNAVTLLGKIETLLSDTLDECSAIEKSVEKSVRGVLLSAQESIATARDYILSAAPGAAGPKSRGKARPSTSARRSTARPAKKRAARA